MSGGEASTPGMRADELSEVSHPEPPSLGRRVLRPQTLLSFGLALLALYFVARRGLGLDLGEVWARMRAADPLIFLLAVAVFYCSFAVRALRWQTLLGNVGLSRAAGVPMPSTAGLAEILYLSWFANCVAVARLGDAYRGYMLKKAAGVSFPVTLGTILAERLIDIVVLAAMLSGSALFAFRGALPPGAGRALAGGLILATIGLLGLSLMRRLRPVVERVLPRRLHPHYARLEEGVTGSFRRVPTLVGLSALGWLLEGSTLFLVTTAIGAPLGPSLPQGFLRAVVVALIASLLTTVPFTPAGLGVAEGGMLVVLRGLGLDPEAAGAVALLNRIITYWSIVLFGCLLYLISRKK